MLGLLDVRVLELTNGLSGAFCAKLLADQGADTLKVELPGRGDPSRHEPPFIGGEAPPRPQRAVPGLQYQQTQHHPGCHDSHRASRVVAPDRRAGHYDRELCAWLP